MRDVLHPDERGIQAVFAAIFLLIVVGGVIDLVLDRPATLASPHVVFEVAMIIVSVAAAAYLANGWASTRRDLSASVVEAELRQQERDEWKQRAGAVLRGLGAEVASQFDAWSLTEAERRVALMLLKGYSHKRVAKVTGTSERTVRQHSVSVYRKAGLAGRAELAGFFLDPLMLPDGMERVT
ncbi:MAG: helix-turn-helix transcriptional regulator [Gemmatimonadota bacterium]|nr:helix-turn-helix transcriptional regulator [Gemmatimonadota bacterium]